MPLNPRQSTGTGTPTQGNVPVTESRFLSTLISDLPRIQNGNLVITYYDVDLARQQLNIALPSGGSGGSFNPQNAEIFFVFYSDVSSNIIPDTQVLSQIVFDGTRITNLPTGWSTAPSDNTTYYSIGLGDRSQASSGINWSLPYLYPVTDVSSKADQADVDNQIGLVNARITALSTMLNSLQDMLTDLVTSEQLQSLRDDLESQITNSIVADGSVTLQKLSSSLQGRIPSISEDEFLSGVESIPTAGEPVTNFVWKFFDDISEAFDPTGYLDPVNGQIHITTTGTTFIAVAIPTEEVPTETFEYRIFRGGNEIESQNFLARNIVTSNLMIGSVPHTVYEISRRLYNSLDYLDLRIIDNHFRISNLDLTQSQRDSAHQTPEQVARGLENLQGSSQLSANSLKDLVFPPPYQLPDILESFEEDTSQVFENQFEDIPYGFNSPSVLSSEPITIVQSGALSVADNQEFSIAIDSTLLSSDVNNRFLDIFLTQVQGEEETPQSLSGSFIIGSRTQDGVTYFIIHLNSDASLNGVSFKIQTRENVNVGYLVARDLRVSDNPQIVSLLAVKEEADQTREALATLPPPPALPTNLSVWSDRLTIEESTDSQANFSPNYQTSFAGILERLIKLTTNPEDSFRTANEWYDIRRYSFIFDYQFHPIASTSSPYTEKEYSRGPIRITEGSAWNTNINYSTGAVVQFQDSTYVALRTTRGNSPDVSTNDWEDLGERDLFSFPNKFFSFQFALNGPIPPSGGLFPPQNDDRHSFISVGNGDNKLDLIVIRNYRFQIFNPDIEPITTTETRNIIYPPLGTARHPLGSTNQVGTVFFFPFTVNHENTFTRGQLLEITFNIYESGGTVIRATDSTTITIPNNYSDVSQAGTLSPPILPIGAEYTITYSGNELEGSVDVSVSSIAIPRPDLDVEIILSSTVTTTHTSIPSGRYIDLGLPTIERGELDFRRFSFALGPLITGSTSDNPAMAITAYYNGISSSRLALHNVNLETLQTRYNSTGEFNLGILPDDTQYTFVANSLYVLNYDKSAQALQSITANEISYLSRNVNNLFIQENFSVNNFSIDADLRVQNSLDQSIDILERGQDILTDGDSSQETFALASSLVDSTNNLLTVKAITIEATSDNFDIQQEFYGPIDLTKRYLFGNRFLEFSYSTSEGELTITIFDSGTTTTASTNFNIVRVSIK